MMRAKTASIKFSEEERVNRFLASLPSSYKSLRRSFRMLEASKRTWEEAMVQFNIEVSDARRDAEGTVKEKGSAKKGNASTARRKAIGPRTVGTTMKGKEKQELGKGKRDRTRYASTNLSRSGSGMKTMVCQATKAMMTITCLERRRNPNPKGGPAAVAGCWTPQS